MNSNTFDAKNKKALHLGKQDTCHAYGVLLHVSIVLVFQRSTRFTCKPNADSMYLPATTSNDIIGSAMLNRLPCKQTAKTETKVNKLEDYIARRYENRSPISFFIMTRESEILKTHTENVDTLPLKVYYTRSLKKEKGSTKNL